MHLSMERIKQTNETKKTKKTSPDIKNDPWDVDIQACSTTDCTGLIPAPPQDEAELHHYEELYQFRAKAEPENQTPRSKPRGI